MDDRMIMDDILTTTKSIADLYLHGAIESATANVHDVFDSNLCDTLKMQNEIYGKMSQHGWYTETVAEQQKIDATKQKFSAK